MKRLFPRALLVVLAALMFSAAAASAATNPLIHGNQIANGAISHSKLNGNSVWNNDVGAAAISCGKLTLAIRGNLSACGGTNGVGPTGAKGDTGARGATGAAGAVGPAGPQGPAGVQGPTGFEGSFYSVERYTETVGVGAIATVACDPNDATRSQQYVAISGGVQNTDSASNMVTNSDPLSVSASFPGRMSFSTDSSGNPVDTPKPGRLDGWIVQFAHTGTQDNNIAVWALCVPAADDGGNVPVVVNDA